MDFASFSQKWWRYQQLQNWPFWWETRHCRRTKTTNFVRRPEKYCNWGEGGGAMAWLWLKFFLFKAWRDHLKSFRTCVFWNPHLTNPSKQKAVRTVAQQLDRFSSLRAAFSFSSAYRVSRSFLSTAFSQTSPIRTSFALGLWSVIFFFARSCGEVPLSGCFLFSPSLFSFFPSLL